MKSNDPNNEFDFFDNGGYEEEVNFGKVMNTSHRTFGIFYLLVVVGIIIAGLAFLDNQSWTFMNNYDDTAILPEYKQEPIQEKRAMTLAGIDVMEAAKPTDEKISRGKEVYSEYCTSCHGDNGMGDGLAGAALNPPPRNFHTTDGWTNGRGIADIYKTLEEGIIENGMSSYDYLPVDDRFALIHFIRSLSPDAPEPDDTELQNLDLAYNLSEGKQTNNQIPLEKAMELMAGEAKTTNLAIAAAVSKMERANDPELRRIFGTALSDKSKAIRLLSKNGNWRESVTAMESMILNGLERNGFSSRYNTLTSADKAVFHSALRDYMTVVPETELDADDVMTEPSDYRFETKEEEVLDD